MRKSYHFSGHGSGVQGLAFEDEAGCEQLVTGEALAGLLGQFSNQVECVLINACYSQVQLMLILSCCCRCSTELTKWSKKNLSPVEVYYQLKPFLDKV